jgi:hypothetical protein
MSKNLNNVYQTNPATTPDLEDLIYLGRLPYAPNDDYAIKWTDLQSNITAVGNVGEGTWNANTIQVNHGGTGVTSIPKFLVALSGIVSVPGSTWTLVPFDVVDFDTASSFSSNKFQPTVAGYYNFSLTVTLELIIGDTYVNLYSSLSKNGISVVSSIAPGLALPTSSDIFSASVSCYIYLNGTTDYVEGYVFQNAGGARNLIASGNGHYTFLTGSLSV